jgi:uncharacterized protein YegJ (DUF2314 family)
MYFDDKGRIYGAYTLRVLLPHMVDSERLEMEASLMPLPE